MIDEKEAQSLMIRLIELRKEAKDSTDAQLELKKHEILCIEKFKYLVTMKTGRYKAFSNFDDLNQEGFEALCMAMANYNPSKGSFFWWAHKYIDTRIARSANLHTTIRYPLKVAKEVVPHKESSFPVLLTEEKLCPDYLTEESEIKIALQKAIETLTSQQKEVISLFYGIGTKPLSIAKICQKLNINRTTCLNNMNLAIELLKENIKL